MRIHFLQHVDFEGPGLIADWAAKNSHEIQGTQLFSTQVSGLELALPPLDEFDMLLVLGGPMNIYQYDEYPWLRQEKQFIKQAIQAKKKVLGICLGAQLIADCLDAKTTANPEKEIGWFPVSLSKKAQLLPYFEHWPAEANLLHWHGDTFAIPAQAVAIGSSAACVNQGFVYGDHVIGLQFHIEWPVETGWALIEEDYPLEPHQFVQDAHAIMQGPFETFEALLFPMLDKFIQ